MLEARRDDRRLMSFCMAQRLSRPINLLERSQLLVTEGRSSEEDITKNSSGENQKTRLMKAAFSSGQLYIVPGV